MRAVVVALGDLGRSARMRYHAQALTAHGVDVDLVGFDGTPLPRALNDDPRITVHRLSQSLFRHGAPRLSYTPVALLDALRIGYRLWRTLRLRPPDLVLVQNPPAFPTLTVTRLALVRRGVRFVIDWHNIGYTVLRIRLGQWNPVVRFARWLERHDAQRADAHLCVSRGLAEFLKSRFALKNTHVLYDRPASIFTPIQHVDRERYRQALLTRLGVHSNSVGLVVCPTSWTEDEDFDVVIDAVTRLEDRVRGWEAAGPGRRFPDVAILVTGDGARRVEFERRFAGLQARRVHLRARWLEPEDYPRVVGSADVGLCLHRSSSGLDIPMKVADMFGAGVPVCALDYGATLAERVRHGSNGLLFATAEQLASVLFDLFESFPADDQMFERLRNGARKSARMSWEEGWRREAQPVLLPEGR